MSYPRRSALLVLLLTTIFPGEPAKAGPPERGFTGPWNLESLKEAPQATWGAESDLIREVYYEGESFQGKPTRVFAYYGKPKGEGPFPAMVLVHGGGGKAFREWAKLWAERGYAALAMDLAGHGPDGPRLDDGGPDQDDHGKFQDFADSDVGQMWTYHAVAAVIRGHSLLAARPEVDAKRIGITGISWGGYLTCIVAGLDDRLKVAVPVYGCGFLNDNSFWLGQFKAMSPTLRDRWLSLFDPSKYLGGVRCPILFVNGTNDFAYPLDSYQKSYHLVPGPVDLCVTVRMPHGHSQGWTPQEIGLFVGSVLEGGKRLARLGAPVIADGLASAAIESQTPLVQAELAYTTDEGEWPKREWKTVEATLSEGKASAMLPEKRPLVFFLTVKDDRGAVASSPHVELK
ncbi:alpha/beta hydrolase family protein [Singulisphaera acidiphila]|uniref:Acetyl xylan esterase (AXE1)/PhoPQ-activated pathogenicity-related protein n=1 Tax=Singulisphaera acidiphila (strain ATCC BAA-1392 / DSM 18658 / VKM B-2454 / MOB10) TaxID=886293 RepID=L0DJH1_SINAD|nr:alpha/beta fold hydrolase [Singulisphaera acidiphila]AGA29392.1 Acetyl xylan esterase (AXE1)/PhoPQ-activated pathogenicity-related protein [Singulisphaera acidiphila DSM 18658]